MINQVLFADNHLQFIDCNLYAEHRSIHKRLTIFPGFWWSYGAYVYSEPWPWVRNCKYPIKQATSRMVSLNNSLNDIQHT